jgi:hemerythrin-like domain-containing protein
MNSPTDILREEHRLILRALETLERAAERLEVTGSLPDGVWDTLLEWLGAFTDRNHHGKEERLLFPAMVKAGVPAEGGPMAVMLAEHNQGRAIVLAMTHGPTPGRAARAREFVELLRAHIAKENEIVFPLAEAVLDEQTVWELCRAFQALETEVGRDPSIARAEATLVGIDAALARGQTARHSDRITAMPPAT